MKNLRKNKKIYGFSLTETIIAVAIFSAIFLAIFIFGNHIFSFNSSAQKNLNAQTGARQVLKSIVKELRSASPSSLGSYPISLASTSAVTFFADIDDDSYKEQIRYFLSGAELKKGVIDPSGSPLVYNSASEKIYTMASGINNGGSLIFEYFDSNYTGTSTPLSQPINIPDIRFIRIILEIEEDDNKSIGPFVVTSQVFLRNLKDNL